MFVVDLSAGYSTVRGADLVRIGAGGFIAYTGCNSVAKNITKARFSEYLDCGLMGALVIENGATDMLGGGKAGAEMGQNWLRGAEAVGYDVAHCVGFTSGDFNAVNQSQYTALYDCQSAFASYVPVHAYYGDQDSGDVIVAGSEALYLWQSDSTSFSHGTSRNARLLQRYNDPRAQGLPVDVNDVLGLPLYFQGEQVTTPAQDASAVWANPITVPAQWSATGLQPANYVLSQILSLVTVLFNAQQAPAPEQPISADQIQAIATAVVAQLPSESPGLTAEQVTQLIDQELTGRTINLVSSATIGALPTTQGESA